MEPDLAHSPTLVAPALEAFTLETAHAGQEDRARAAAAEALGAEWTVTPFGDRGTDYEVTHPDAGRLSPAEAWERAYRLRGRPGIVSAEPVFAVYAPVESDEPEHDESLGSGKHGAESDPTDWSARLVRAPEAWQMFAAKGIIPGEGIVVGHPDTGYRRHPEIVANLLIERGKDFLDFDNDAEDDLRNPGHVILHHPSHGTGTASVIVSPRRVPSRPDDRDVVGIAPGARVMPLRVSRTVVLVSMLNLSRAIEYTAEQGAHVVSISMGGVWSARLRKSVVYAQRRGVIVLAAAGNEVRFVVWPAAYEEVIAVAACNALRRPWRGSSRGGAVDVTGPGESVWRARTVLKRGAEKHEVERSSGTSYAVATVAGIAALWLSYHGRDALAERYGAEKIPFIFNQVLRSTAVAVPTLGRGFGRGLVDAAAVLRAPLPGDEPGLESLAPAPAANLDAHPPVDAGGLETFSHLFGGTATESGFESAAWETTPSHLPGALAELLGVSTEELPQRLREVGQEVAFHLATDPELYRRFERLASLEEGPVVDAGALRAELAARGSPALSRRLARPGAPDGF